MQGAHLVARTTLIIPESVACCVSVFTPEGGKIHSFGSKYCQQLPMIPIADGEFDISIGVTVWTIIISDQDYSQIQMFTAEGRSIVSIGEYGRGNYSSME